MLNSEMFKDEIRDAWEATIPPPEDTRLVLKDWGEYAECKNAFRGLLWQNIPFEFARFHRECVMVFLPAALIYYLPAFILGSIDERNEDDEAWDLTEYTLIAITKILSQFQRYSHTLSEKQLKSIDQYLTYLLHSDLADGACDQVTNCLLLMENHRNNRSENNRKNE